MNKILTIIFFLNLSNSAFGQEKGIYFEKGQSWSQLKAKAKAQNKYIFMDIYATWCGPCRWMDENTYSSDKLTVINDKFISVKVQSDTTRSDNDEVKSWHKVLSKMNVEYHVNSFPTYLFFNPDGNAVHKFLGQVPDSVFLKIALNALDPNKQFYTLQAAYHERKLEYGKFPSFIGLLRYLGEKEHAKIVAEDYIDNFLYKLNDSELFKKEYILFIVTEGGETFSSKSKLFPLIYNNPNKIDSIVGNKGFAQNIIGWTVKKEELYNKLWNKDKKPFTKSPDWKRIEASIKKKYNAKYADSLTLPAILLFYQLEKNWVQYSQWAEKSISKYPPKRGGRNFAVAVGVDPLSPGTDAWGLNLMAWSIFEDCDDVAILNKALKWSTLSIALESVDSQDLHQYIDTKANLLYKLGRVDEAIALEEEALINPFATVFVKNYQETIAKMRRGEITWKAKKNI